MNITNDLMKEFVKDVLGKEFTTIEDMMQYCYGSTYTGGPLAKDAPVITSTTGVRNIVYGRRLWEQIVYAQNAFGILPKKPWDHSGYRAVTAAAATTGGGVSEGAAIPATVKPTFAEIDVEPKDFALAFDMSARQRVLEGKDDVVYWADLKTNMEANSSNLINRHLVGNVTTVAGNNFESIDRICSSYGEVTNCADVNANDSDIYGLDRDSTTTWSDAYVGHNSDTNRYLTLGLIDTMIETCQPYWNNSSSMENKVLLTGYDTYTDICSLMRAQQRYDTTKVQITMNGIQTAKGTEAGFDVASYRGIPIIRDANVLQDTISRIYLLDLDHLWFSTGLPMMYLESSDYQHIDKFVTEGVFYMIGELTCTKFKAQGKVRDLK